LGVEWYWWALAAGVVLCVTIGLWVWKRWDEYKANQSEEADRQARRDAAAKLEELALQVAEAEARAKIAAAQAQATGRVHTASATSAVNTAPTQVHGSAPPSVQARNSADGEEDDFDVIAPSAE
jgi:type VI protein secretion system component VasK